MTLRLVAAEGFSALATSTAGVLIRLWIILVLYKGAESSTFVSVYLTLLSATALVAGLIAGTVVDRHRTIPTIWIATAVRVCLSLGLICVMFYAYSGINNMLIFSLVCALMCAVTACTTIYDPAVRSLVQALTPKDTHVRMFSWLQFAGVMASTLGPMIAGYGARIGAFLGIIWIEIVGLVLAAMCLIGLHKKSDKKLEKQVGKGSLWRDWRFGLKTLAEIRIFRKLLPFAIIEAVGAAGLSLSVMFFVLNTIEVGAGWYGICSAAMSAGLACGYLLAGKISKLLYFNQLLVLSNAGVAVFLFSAACSGHPLAVAIFLFAACFSQALVGPSFQALFIASVPECNIGQAFSTFIAIVGAIAAISTPMWGWISQLSPDRVLSGFGIDGNTAIFILISMAHLGLAAYAKLVPPVEADLRV